MTEAKKKAEQKKTDAALSKERGEDPKKDAPKPAAKKKDPTYEELIEFAGRKMGQGPGIVTTHWQNVQDALIQAQEVEKRSNFIAEGRITEGENANKNVVRDGKQRVE